VSIHEAKTQLSRLVQAVAAGEEIIVAKAGKPLAKLVPIDRELEPRRFGSMRGKIWMADDFDEPLPPEVLAGFLGEDHRSEGEDAPISGVDGPG
jgi:prevent-host-death family protein